MGRRKKLRLLRIDREQEREESRRLKACEGKDKLTKMVARTRARALSLQLREQIGYYECEYCGHWHIGH